MENNKLRDAKDVQVRSVNFYWIVITRDIIFIMIGFIYGICETDLINSPRKYSGN